MTDEQDHNRDAILVEESLPDDGLPLEKSTDVGDSEEVVFLYFVIASVSSILLVMFNFTPTFVSKCYSFSHLL